MPLRGRLVQSAGSLLALTLIASALLQVDSPARAATTYDIQVGHVIASPAGAESRRFFPSSIKIAQGDKLHLTSQGFHSATLLPMGEIPADWLAENWGGRDKPYSPILSDPDDGKTQVKLNPAAVVASDPECGLPWQSPCEYDGASVVHSGISLTEAMDFSVVVTTPAPATFWAVDLADPAMRMKVDVVEDETTASLQSEIDTQRAKTITTDTSKAKKLIATYSKPTKTVAKSGAVTWNAYPGVDSKNVSVRKIMPFKLTVKANDRVLWRFDKLSHEIHSVTFPKLYGQGLNSSLPEPKCDRDSDSGPGPDDPPDLLSAPYCEDPSQAELDIPAEFVGLTGDALFAGGTDIGSSGLRGSKFGLKKGTYTLKFTKAKKAGYSYVCSLHTFMTGKVVVRP